MTNKGHNEIHVFNDLTAGHTDVIFKEVEINRRSIAVHAVIQQYRLTFYIYKQLVYNEDGRFGKKIW